MLPADIQHAESERLLHDGAPADGGGGSAVQYGSRSRVGVIFAKHMRARGFGALNRIVMQMYLQPSSFAHHLQEGTDDSMTDEVKPGTAVARRLPQYIAAISGMCCYVNTTLFHFVLALFEDCRTFFF